MVRRLKKPRARIAAGRRDLVGVAASKAILVDEAERELIFTSEFSEPTFAGLLVRQLTILDTSGAVRIEHLRCAISLEPAAELDRLGTGVIWSEPGELQSWIDRVQASMGFAAMLDKCTTVLDISVTRDTAE